MESRINAIAQRIAAAHGVTARLDYRVGYPAVINTEAAVARAVDAAVATVGRPGEGLHGDHYIFNDKIVPITLRYWINLVKQTLPP